VPKGLRIFLIIRSDIILICSKFSMAKNTVELKRLCFSANVM